MVKAFREKLAAYQEKWMSWFSLLPERDKKLLIFLIVFATLVIGYSLFFRPLNEWKKEAEIAYEREKDTSTFIKRNIEWAAILQKQKSTGQSGLSLVNRISRSASRSEVTLTRVQPARGGATILADAVEYKKLLAWLLLLHNVENIEVEKISIDQGKQEGVVKVFARLSANLTD